MPLLRAQTILPMFTNLPKDVVVNQTHWLADEIDIEDACDDIATMLTSFYTTVYGAASARVNYINWPAATIKIFNLAEPTPRVPYIRSLGFTTAGTGTSTIPTEVACVLTFRAEATSGVPFQRLYNRIYLGALPSTALQASTASEFPRFSSSFLAQVQSAAATLTGIPTYLTRWVQVSNAGPVTAVRPIVGGWVDNGPDTQRRRSVLASARNNWAATP